MREFLCPMPVCVDAYQAGHFDLIPPGMNDFECSQGVYRKPLDPDDHRIISAGLAPFIALNLRKPVTQDDINNADDFYSDFHADLKSWRGKPYPWPKAMFQKVVDEYNGYLPVVISGLMDGMAHYVGEPHVQVWTDVPGMGELVGWIESTMLPYLWTSSIVATKGRRRKDKMIQVFKEAYPSKTEKGLNDMVAYKFHDFGRRGAASSQITGIAHLINWLGTDTVDAAYAATKYLNDRLKFGACSIMAAAHRTITPWPTEDEAYAYMVKKYSNGLLSIVADSYDYRQGMEKLGSYAEVVKTAGGFLVGRPDSGDPTKCVLDGLAIFAKAFGYTVQEKGLKVLNNSGIIQGDGVNDEVIFNQIYPAVVAAGYCPSNVAFGMGEHNHSCVRSQTEHGYKTCTVGTTEADTYRSVMKGSNSRFKMSIPTPVGLCHGKMSNGYRVYAVTVDGLKQGLTGDLFVQYDGRKVLLERRESFSRTRDRAYDSWKDLTPVCDDTFEPDIRSMQREYMLKHLGK